uniref:CxC7-like cysteine cluster associated with KDZ transposases domain-containing protein n=1 Tax=Neogobius melanostomus TaxID=47308 RepID=A0A8C6SRF9_9GOBI
EVVTLHKSQHEGPFLLEALTNKGVATIKKGSVLKKLNVSRLRPYYRFKGENPQDHGYSAQSIDHTYSWHGFKWDKDLIPAQEDLLNYILDQGRPSGELIVKDGQICLTREDFWSLGLKESLESNIGNACLKIVEEEAKRVGKYVYIADLYAVATWKAGSDPLLTLPENMASKDAVVLPAWSHRSGFPDHYLLCILLVKQRKMVLLDSVNPEGFGNMKYFEVFSGVCTWSKFSPAFKKEYYRMYSISTCRSCGDLYKDSTPGTYFHSV